MFLSAAVTIAACAILAWAGGLLWFASTIPTDVEDRATHTDAIVVLTGGSERIETGLALLNEGLAERLFVSGVGEQVKTGDFLPQTRTLPPDLRDNVAVGKTAGNTPGNALETAAWAHSMNVQSIHAAMPGVMIVPHAVFPPNVKTDWWRWPGTASLIAREYTKYIVTWAIQRTGLSTAPASRLTMASRTGS